MSSDQFRLSLANMREERNLHKRLYGRLGIEATFKARMKALEIEVERINQELFEINQVTYAPSMASSLKISDDELEQRYGPNKKKKVSLEAKKKEKKEARKLADNPPKLDTIREVTETSSIRRNSPEKRGASGGRSKVIIANSKDRATPHLQPVDEDHPAVPKPPEEPQSSRAKFKHALLDYVKRKKEDDELQRKAEEDREAGEYIHKGTLFPKIFQSRFDVKGKRDYIRSNVVPIPEKDKLPQVPPLLTEVTIKGKRVMVEEDEYDRCLPDGSLRSYYLHKPLTLADVRRHRYLRPLGKMMPSERLLTVDEIFSHKHII